MPNNSVLLKTVFFCGVAAGNLKSRVPIIKVSSGDKKVDVKDALKNWFSGTRRVVIVGIGNPLRKDDFVGVEIVRNLQNRVSQSVYLIEAETVPESFIDPITKFKPTHILIIDAGLLNQKSGTSKLASTKQLTRKSSTSTHMLPLRIFCDYLTETTGAKISLLVIQPKDTSFGEELTPKLRETATNLTNSLLKILP
ncbi:hydrogenase 3 maturation endopeptidase HyCI [Candidatus Bathyarchaeota archaeon]|nr:hydrogenase 3 maturation endopeptidase HyCI [Candidatus Bathyarchaeota archaeon]